MNKAESLRQSVRLSTLNGWDRMEEAGREELRSQLERIFPDERSASAAIDFWMLGNRWLPTPADLHSLAADFVERPQAPTDRRCGECGGTGFRPCWELHTYLGGLDRHGELIKTVERVTQEKWSELRKTVDGFTQRAVEAVEGCQCNYGRFLSTARRAERARKEAELHEKRARRAS